MEGSGFAMIMCPKCGAFISDKSEACPNCGAKLEESEEQGLELKRDEIAELSEEDSDVLLCPRCGQEMPEDGGPCKNCGTEIKKDIPLKEEKPEEGKGVALFLCSVCGAFTSEEEETCPSCGSSLIEEPEEAAPVAPVVDAAEPSEPEITLEEEVIDMLVASEDDETPPEDDEIFEMIKGIESPEDVVSLMEVISDTEVDEELEGLELDISEPAETPDAKAVEDEEPEEIDLLELAEDLERPETEDEKDEEKPVKTDLLELAEKLGKPEVEKEEEKKEPLDMDVLELAELETTETDEKKEEEPAELAHFEEEMETEVKKAGAIESVESKIAGEVEVKPTGREMIGLCSKCGAFVSPDQDNCGVCGASLSDAELILPSTIVEPADERDASDKVKDILKTVFGIDEDVELEPIDGLDRDESLDICTICGAFLVDEVSKCPVCGTMAEDMPEFVPEPIEEMKEEVSLSICPNCGAFLNEGVTKCNVCAKEIPDGAALKKDSPDEIKERTDDLAIAEKVLEKAFGVFGLKDTEPVERVPESSSIDLCPDCGAFISLNAAKCPVCGTALVESIEKEIETEDVDDILDLELTIDEISTMECPSCGSTIDVGSDNCPLCGLAFVTDVKEPEIDEGLPGEDITDFLEKELPMTIDRLEKKAAEAVITEEAEIETDEVVDMVESLELGEKGPKIKTDEVADKVEPPELGEEIPKTKADEAVDKAEPFEPEEKIPEIKADEVVDRVEPLELGEEIPEIKADEAVSRAEALEPGEEIPEIKAVEPVEPAPESLAWEEDSITELYEKEFSFELEPAAIEEIEEIVEDIMPEIEAKPEPVAAIEMELPAIKPKVKEPVNWEYGIYGSVTAIIGFLIAHLIAPGDHYPIALAMWFGVMCLYGIYLGFTEKGTFIKGDMYKSMIFLIGCLILCFIILHWPVNVLTGDTGALAQPGFDRVLLSMGILFIGVGIIWMRARVRYVFTWFFGTVFLFFCSAIYTQPSIIDGSGSVPSVLLVGGLGAGLVFASLGFLTYERAIKASIETDIVRGDAEYVRRDYESALASYDSALDKTLEPDTRITPPIHYDVPWYSKGSALILMGELEAGIECLDMALAINPNNEVTWLNKGNAHSRLGQHDIALECFNRAIQLNPNYEIAWNNRGNVLARQQKYIVALKSYNMAIKINPRYDDVWINKGYVLVKMGKREEAMKCLNYIKTGPDAISSSPGHIQSA